jgi:hypothetical protein
MDCSTVDIHKNSRDRKNVFYLPPCADVDKFKYVDYGKRNIPALFLGNADLIPRRDWLEPLEKIVSGADIRYFPHRQPKGRPVAKGDKKWVGTKDHPALYSSCIVGLNVHRSPAITRECFQTRIVQRLRKPVPRGLTLCNEMPGKEGTGFWNDGNIGADHVNPRFFEMAACGTLVVSDDHRSELARMFPMAPRAPTPAKFVELVLYYLNHLDEAEEIGRTCSYLVSNRHTYLHRALEVLIRLGFKELREGDQRLFLEAPEDWLSPQDLPQRKATSLLERTGRSEPWSPQYGMSWTRQSGNPKGANSLSVPKPWL